MKISQLSRIIMLMIAVMVFSGSVVAAEDDLFNEDDLFSDPDSVIDSSALTDASVSMAAEKPGISFSGSIYNTNWYEIRRSDYLLKNPILDDQGPYTGNVTANILVDARYKAGIKAFGNFDLIWYSQGTPRNDYSHTRQTDALVRELFCDANISSRVYFRFGKQFLKWGRNYFWNPTDLINVDKKSFTDLDRNLEGTRGIKISVPFGTRYNIYSFIQLEDVDDFEDIAWSGKFEFLSGNTEYGLSVWYKDGYEPVYGLDFSTRLFRLDVQGEFSLCHGENKDRLRYDGSVFNIPFYKTYRRKDEWVPQASLGVTKTFDLLDVNDRVMVRSEFFYNDAGYDDKVFDDPYFVLQLLGKGLYEPNYVSKYYGSVFLSLQQFIISEMTLRLNFIANFTEESGIITTGLSYNPRYDRYDLLVDISASAYVGNGRDEYTFTGNRQLLGLEIRFRF